MAMVCSQFGGYFSDRCFLSFCSFGLLAVLRSNRYRTKVLASLDMTRRRAKKHRLGGGSILVAVLLVQPERGAAICGRKETKKEEKRDITIAFWRFIFE